MIKTEKGSFHQSPSLLIISKASLTGFSPTHTKESSIEPSMEKKTHIELLQVLTADNVNVSGFLLAINEPGSLTAVCTGQGGAPNPEE